MRVLRRHEDPDLRRHEDPDVDDVVTTDDTVATRRSTDVAAVSRWSMADGLVAIVGAALALVGAIALVRTGVNETWFRPVEEVLNANHTALLGAAELGAGVLLVLAGATHSRVLAALVGLGMAIGGALAAIETSEVSRELAIEDWWAWTLAAAGAFVAMLALLVPRTVRRVVETT